MKENQITVIIKRPGEKPEVVPLFENTLEAFQKAVGGYVETVTITDDVVIICDEEGRLKGKPLNMVLGMDFRGALVFAGIKGDEFTSLPPSAVNPILRGGEDVGGRPTR